MIGDHVRLIWWFAKRWRRRGEDFDDFASVCAVALAHAARSHAGSDSALMFSTYGVNAMRWAVANWRKGERRFRCVRWAHGRGVRRRVHSRYLVLFSELGDHFVHGRAREFATVEHAGARIDDADDAARKVARYTKNLNKRHLEIVRCRFGLETGQPMTLDETARRMRITRERVRQIEAKAMLKMRDAVGRGDLTEGQ